MLVEVFANDGAGAVCVALVVAVGVSGGATGVGVGAGEHAVRQAARSTMRGMANDTRVRFRIAMLVRLLLALAVACGCGGSTLAETVPARDAAAPADASCDCVSAGLEWEENGGFVAYTDTSSIARCSDYAQSRSPSASPVADYCAAALGCDGVTKLNAALAHADVQKAIASAPILYGKDPRAYDGTVFQVKIGGKMLEVGDECGGAAGCTAPPPGVIALRDLLRAFDTAQESGACKALK